MEANVRVMERFWAADEKERIMIHPLIAYADLICSGDAAMPPNSYPWRQLRSVVEHRPSIRRKDESPCKHAAVHIVYEGAGMVTATVDRYLMGIGLQADPQRQFVKAFVSPGEEAFLEQFRDASIHGDDGIQAKG